MKTKIFDNWDGSTILYYYWCDDELRIDKFGQIWRHPYIYKDKKVDKSCWSLVSFNPTQDGYYNFTWHGRVMYNHKVIAEAFCYKCGYDPDGTIWDKDEKIEVDHIDRNRQNNTPSNLRWVSGDWNRKHKGKYKKTKLID